MKTVYVDVEDELAEFLETKTKEERHDFIVFEWKSKLVERKETRRHTSMDMLHEKGVDFPDYSQDIDFVLDWNEEYKREQRLEKLQKKVLAKYLPERQAKAFYQFVLLRFKKRGF